VFVVIKQVNEMARANNSTVRIPDDLATVLDGIKGDLSRTEIAVQMITKGLNTSTDSADSENAVELDPTTFHYYFKHLTCTKGKEYQADLKALAMTELELVDSAIAKSGKRYGVFMKEAMLTYAKEQLTLAARREYQDEHTEGSPEKRLQTAFEDLTEKVFSGQYSPKNGRLNVSAIAARAGVNFNTAKKWAESYQPELVENGT